MLGFMRKARGTISVFLILVLMPTFVLTALLIDGTAVFGAKNIINGAGELAMGGALAHYDEKLLDYYGLIAMDSKVDVEGKAKTYFETTLDTGPVSNYLGISRNGRAFIRLKGNETALNRVDNTQVYQSYVMESQVLEFMKYRAPAVLLAGNILEKVTAFDGLSEQKDCIKKELDYEDKMAKIQEKLNELHDRLSEYISAPYPSSYKTYSQIVTWNQELEKGQAELTKLLIARAAVNSHIIQGHGLESVEAAKRVVEIAEKQLGGDIAENFEGINSINDYASDVKDKHFSADYEKGTPEYEEMKDLEDKYEEALNKKEDCWETLMDKIDRLEGKLDSGENLKKKANDFYIQTKNLRDNFKEWDDLCEDIEDKLKKSESSRKAWRTSIDKLKSEDQKKEFETAYNKFNGLYNADGSVAVDSEIGQLRSKLQEDMEYMRDMMELMNQMSYCGAKYAQSDNWSNIINTASLYGANTTTVSSLKSNTSAMLQSLIRVDFSPVSGKKLHDYKDDAFYKRMHEPENPEPGSGVGLCRQVKPETDMDESGAKSHFKNMVSQGKSEEVKDETNNSHLSESMKSKKLPSNQGDGGAEPAGGPSDNGSGDLKNIDDPEKKQKDAKKAGDTALDSSDSTTGDLEAFASGAVAAGGQKNALSAIYESAYEATYIMEMLSNRTSGVKDDSATSLKRKDMKKDYLYHGEAEYILWGNDEPKNAVTTNETVIFTIRFLLNAITAFTNSKLRQEAAGLASVIGAVFPLSAPLIQSAILLGCALAETSLDQSYLINKGESVTIIKDYNTWYFRPLGFADNKNVITQGRVTLSYKEYTWLLLAATMISESGKSSKLLRTADCIELNMTQTDIGGNSIIDEYTMVSMESTVDLDTFFLRKIPAYLASEGRSAGGYDGGNFSFPYRSALGY